jgi:predicted metalloprotease with PDZ domain
LQSTRIAQSRLAIALVVLLSPAALTSAERPAAVSFTVSAPEAAAHLFHVDMRCESLSGEEAEFRMPAWTPGYYGLFDFAGNVRNFSASDGSGRELAWRKSSANGWTVRTGGTPSVALKYDVLATRAFVANAYVDSTRGYILPGAVFLYVPGRLREPVTVTVVPPPGWPDVATGLDRAPAGGPRTFTAPDFDVLYDSPILMGALESLPPFDVRGIRHDFIGYQLGDFDRAALMKDLQAVIEAAVDIIGEVPYSHYVFLGIGPGQGGIEHLNSAAVSFAAKAGADRAAYIRQLSFLAHEYFHHYNVKRIRPVALGPFDYDRANETNMLWVSEGFTVYYEYLMLGRSGRMTVEDILAALGRSMAGYENNPGRLFQSATASSRETWTQGPFGRTDGRVRKTISYYEKGAILGMLLDFRIRHETRNQRSLDTVMRELYTRYYKALGRGWTDQEFRDTCERAAGGPLDEIFDYASTTRAIDYAKYLDYAGLEMEPPVDRPEPDTGAFVEDRGGRLVVAALEPGSAATAVLAAGDALVAVDGRGVDANGFDELVKARPPGDSLTLTVDRAGKTLHVTLPVGHRVERAFRMKPVARPSALQSAILAAWTAAAAR